MIIRQAQVKQMFRSIAAVWKENSGYFSEIDSRFGDGDHGVTINKIARLMESRVES